MSFYSRFFRVELWRNYGVRNKIKKSLPAFQQELFSPNLGSGKDLKYDKNNFDGQSIYQL